MFLKTMRCLAALLLAVMLTAGCASAIVAENIVDQCAFHVSEGSAEDISDVSISSAWVPSGSNPEMMMRLPAAGASHFQINWSKPAADFEITQYDEARNVLSTTGPSEKDFGFLANVYPIEPSARYISVRFSQPGQGINKIRVYSQGDLPPTAVTWNPPHENCDLMVISTHMDDEWLWFGGIIPLYDTVQGKKVQVVYMADCGRLRHAEALNGLASAGVRTYPVFLDLKDERIDSLNLTLEHWGGRDKLTELMVDLIRRFEPEIILTHDWNGEYGHNQHILTSRCMEYVIAAAADPAQYPASAAEYGAWQVQKLYRHLETKDPIEFNWHVSYPELGGRTLLQTATQAMEENASQLAYYQVKDHGEYDNAKFGLSYSTVGEDKLSQDLFENVVLPTPTPEPTPVPTPSPTPVPTPSPSPTPAPGFAERIGTGGIIGIIAGVLAIAAAAVLFLLRQRQIRRKKARLAALARKRAILQRRRAAAQAGQASVRAPQTNHTHSANHEEE